MRTRMMLDGKGNVQEMGIEVKVEGQGELGKRAARLLAKHVERIQVMETEEELEIFTHAACGYILCCQELGLITEEGVDELAGAMEQLARRVKARIKGCEKKEGGE